MANSKSLTKRQSQALQFIQWTAGRKVTTSQLNKAWNSVSAKKRGRPKKKKKKQIHNLHEFTPEMLAKLPKDVLRDGRYLKKWIRLDLGKLNDQRVWKNATFLTPSVFATRINQERGAVLYHICGELDKHVLYSKLPRVTKGDITCPECDEVISGGVQMITTLQRLRKSRGTT